MTLKWETARKNRLFLERKNLAISQFEGFGTPTPMPSDHGQRKHP
jgi:hypothetical protein